MLTTFLTNNPTPHCLYGVAIARNLQNSETSATLHTFQTSYTLAGVHRVTFKDAGHKITLSCDIVQ